MSQISDYVRTYLTEQPRTAQSVYESFTQDFPEVTLNWDEFLLETAEYQCPQIEGEELYMKIKSGKVLLDTSASDAAMQQAFQRDRIINDSNKIKK